jgi:hypothetical protein
MEITELRKLIAATGKKKRRPALRHPVKVGGQTIYLTDEGLEQYTVAEWLRAYKVKFLHVPNEGKRHPKEGMMLKMLGLEPGASDFLIFSMSPQLAQCPGICLEMKTATGVATENQLTFLREMRCLGWLTFIAYGANAAIEFLENHGYGRGLCSKKS